MEPLTSNPSADELRAAAKDFREREIRLRGYDGASAGMFERAADEIDRLTKREAELVKVLKAVNSEAHSLNEDDVVIYNIAKLCGAALKEQP